MNHYEDVAAILTARHSQEGGKPGRSLTDPYPTQYPSGYLRVEVGKGCVLLLTKAEYIQGLRRGKTWRERNEKGERISEREAT